MDKTILLIATFDTKESEAIFLKEKIESRGFGVLSMDAGILDSPKVFVDVNQHTVAKRGGMSLEEVLATGDKGICISNMVRGAEVLCAEFYKKGLFHGVVAIGGGQGTAHHRRLGGLRGRGRAAG